LSASVGLLAGLLVYVAVGFALARRAGAGPGLTGAAVVAWPLLLADLRGGAGLGPYDRRVAAGLQELRAALAEPAASGLVSPEEVEAVARALALADARVGLADRLLADPHVRESTEGARLQQARDKAAAEVEAVLKSLVQLRVQLGLVALAGETSPVRARLAELAARVKALDEVGA
jgi:hypothetical protein